MVDWNNPQPCGECGKLVHKGEKHTFGDCTDWKKTIKDLRESFDVSKQEGVSDGK